MYAYTRIDRIVDEQKGSEAALLRDEIHSLREAFLAREERITLLEIENQNFRFVLDELMKDFLA